MCFPSIVNKIRFKIIIKKEETLYNLWLYPCYSYSKSTKLGRIQFFMNEIFKWENPLCCDCDSYLISSMLHIKLMTNPTAMHNKLIK